MRCLSWRGSFRLIIYSSTCFSYKRYVTASPIRFLHYRDRVTMTRYLGRQYFEHKRHWTMDNIFKIPGMPSYGLWELWFLASLTRSVCLSASPCFPFLPKLVTLNDLEWRNGRYFCVISRNSIAFGGKLRQIGLSQNHIVCNRINLSQRIYFPAIDMIDLWRYYQRLLRKAALKTGKYRTCDI